jgi:hypothetical protein
LEFFNFFIKFGSNLQNGINGILINISKSVSEIGRHLLLATELLAAGRPRRFLAQ